MSLCLLEATPPQCCFGSRILIKYQQVATLNKDMKQLASCPPGIVPDCHLTSRLWRQVLDTRPRLGQHSHQCVSQAQAGLTWFILGRSLMVSF